MHTPIKIDPYREWFKIRSYVDDVPNNYQLLGVSDFESDIDFIKEAYETRVDSLNRLDISGPNRAMKPRVFSQLESALETLSNPDKKKEYDSWLRLTGRAGLPRLGWGGSFILTLSFALGCLLLTASVYVYPMYAPPEPTGMGDSIKTLPQYQNAASNPVSAQNNLLVAANIPEVSQGDSLLENATTKVAASVDPVASSDESNANLSAGNDNFPNSIPATDFAIDLEAIPVVDISGTDVSGVPASESTDRVHEAPIPADPIPADPIPADPIPVTPNPELSISTPVPATPEVPSVPAAPSVPAPSTDKPVLPVVEDSPFAPDSTNSVASPLAPSAENDSEMQQTKKPELVSTVTTVTNPAVCGRFLVPQEADWKKFQSEISEQYKLNAKSSQADRLAAAEQMLTDCALGTQSADQKFALLQRAADEAGEGGDAELALQSIVAQSRLFAIDLPQTVARVMENCAPKIKTESEAKKLMGASLTAANFCMEAYEYAMARTITEAAYKALIIPAGQEYRSQALQRLNKVKQFESQWADVQKAKQELAATDSPSSAAADVIARWYIEIEEDWNSALPYLLRSGVPELRQLAQKDNITPLSDPQACLKLGDLWWNYSLNQSGTARQAYQRHAVELYKNATQGLDEKSLDRTRIQKRIEDSEK